MKELKKLVETKLTTQIELFVMANEIENEDKILRYRKRIEKLKEIQTILTK